MLLVPSLLMVAYVILRLIAPLPCAWWLKAAASLAVVFAGLKFTWYARWGGAFFAPDLPRPALLAMEALYAALVILVFLLLVRDALLVVLWLGRRPGANWRLPLAPGARGAGLTLLALGLAAFGVWQAVKVPGVRTVELAVAGLPPRLDGFSLVQLSDLHIGPLQKRAWLEAVVDKANSLEPDAFVLTGDYIDGSPAELRDDVAPLARLRARHGVFAVTGNHEYYYHVEDWLPVFAELGMDMLHNEHRVLDVDGALLVIVGVPDLAESRFGGPGPDLGKALEGAPAATRVLLQHQPRGASGHQGVDVQLSGHTHGGLLFFLKPVIAAFNEGMVNGLYVTDGPLAYVHPGTGLWNGFSCRVGAPSEITRLVLRSREPAA